MPLPVSINCNGEVVTVDEALRARTWLTLPFALGENVAARVQPVAEASTLPAAQVPEELIAKSAVSPLAV